MADIILDRQRDYSVDVTACKESTVRIPGLADFAIWLVNSVINLPDGQVNFFEEFKLQKNCEISLLIKTFFGLINVSFSLPEWQAVKITFLAP